MKVFKIFTSISLVIALSLNAKAQKSASKDADKAFASFEYFKAIDLYKKASTKEKNKAKRTEYIFKTAECYRMIGDNKQAEVFYAKAIKAKYPDPIAQLKLADAIKANGRYNDAIIEYDNYKKLAPSDPRGDQGSKSSADAQKWKDAPTRFQVNNLAQVNSGSNDFAPTFIDRKYSTIYFTSMREGSAGSGTDNTIGQSFSDIYEVKVDKKGKWSTPTPIDKTINSSANEGASIVNKKGTKIYFTRCEMVKKKFGCTIMVADKMGTAWGTPTVIDLKTDTFVVGHPAINVDETKLYFSSDMPGGMGGKDLWVSTYDKGGRKWGEPVNMGGKFNTEGDEMYPFVRDNGDLYFASNGLSGMGGLDIFVAAKNGDGFGTPENLKYPINSPADDFGLIYEAKSNRGYLSSSREGGKGGDDIWSFTMPPLVYSVMGKVLDVDSKEPIVGAVVKLIGSDGSSVEQTTDAKGSYNFDATPDGKRYVTQNVSYTISSGMDKYLGDKGTFTTVGSEVATAFTKDLNLKSIKKGPIRLPDILYDLSKWDLKPQYQDSLNGLITTLNNNPNITIELGSHTDTRDNNKNNAILSQKRAQSVVDYLILKGIAADRLAAKGYGEERPLISDAEIGKLKSTEEKEAAHQKNRRSEFKVLREDYVPKVDPNAPKVAPKVQDASGEEEEKDGE
jgi:peptidoglycan-associated lipoprotein